MTVQPSIKNRALFFSAAIGVIVLLLILILLQSLNAALNIPTFHLDGAFQTASGLFRIDSGQAPGRDFFPYLGLGPLLSIYPFFKLAGGTLSASVFATQFVTLAIGWISISVLCQLIFRPKMMRHSLVGGAVVFVLIFFIVNQFSSLTVFTFAFEPGNSLRPIRAAIPYILGFLSLYLLNSLERGFLRSMVVGLAVGVALLWSNDFAIPTAALFALLYCFISFREKTDWKKNAVAFGIVAFAFWLILLSIITVGHSADFVKYNFIDVATDQWWYFGSYDPSKRVFELGHLSKVMSRENYFSLMILFFTAILANKTRNNEHLLLSAIGWTTFFGGVLPTLGGYVGGYFGAFNYWGAVTAFLAVLRSIQVLVVERLSSKSQDRGVFEIALVVLTFILFMAAAVVKWSEYKANISAAERDPNRFYVPEFGGYLATTWKSYIDYAREHKNSRAIEEYWGVWSSLNRSFASWPVDSVIHALGGVRKATKQAIADADIVISTRYSTSPEWQPWSLSQNFWFYEELLLAWSPDFVSPTTIVWKKNVEARVNEDVGCKVTNDRRGFVIESDVEGFYSVTVNYSSTGAGRHLLMLKNNISYGADAGGYVSLPPGGGVVTIPVLLTSESGNIFESKIIGSDEMKLSVLVCDAKRISFKDDDILHRQSESEFYLTDGNWVRGVARGYAGFFVPNKVEFREKFKTNKCVCFKNGDRRRIKNVAYSGQYINVDIEGPPLDSSDVGLPSEFDVVDVPPQAGARCR